jgi:hypothetical protein
LVWHWHKSVRLVLRWEFSPTKSGFHLTLVTRFSSWKPMAKKMKGKFHWANKVMRPDWRSREQTSTCKIWSSNALFFHFINWCCWNWRMIGHGILDFSIMPNHLDLIALQFRGLSKRLRWDW